MTLYNTYRPRSFDDVVGQKHVVQTLTNAIKRNIIGHAYLFTGPRGTGKTTIGRIFAHAVNCMPRKNFTPSDASVCNDIIAGTSLDVIEIDAASHTSVDSIRELRDTVAIPPSRAHYKVYIVDEAHMLSTAAWNAFLKTLEEPPPHVIFIFATTEVHKVPETILSRVQRFDLTRISINDISNKLLAIAQKEKISLDTDSAAMIASASGGSMRDAESLLAQVMAFARDRITPQDVRSVLGITERRTVFALIKYILRNDTAAALATLARIVDAGHNLNAFTTSLITIVRHGLIGGIDEHFLTHIAQYYDEKERLRLTKIAQVPSERLIAIIEEFTKARTNIAQSAIPQLPLEIAIIRLTTHDNTKNQDGTHETQSDSSSHKEKGGVQESRTIAKSIRSTYKEDPLRTLTQLWPMVIASVKKENAAFATLLRYSTPHSIKEKTLTLITTNTLLAEKIKNRTLYLTLRNAVATICGEKLIIVVRTDEAPSPSLIAHAMQIMRGSHIVESA